jgi:DNA/RNA endonuclease YhcR with UshA esterase domain
MGTRQYHINTGDMFVVPIYYNKIPIQYVVTCIIESLPNDKYQTLQVSIDATTGTFRVSPCMRSRTALLHKTIKHAMTGSEYEDFKLRFLVECGNTLEGKIREAVGRLKKYPNRYRVKIDIDPNMIVINPENMKSKGQLRKKKWVP